MLTFTDRAHEMVRTFIDSSEGELDALRIAMEGTPLAPTFELTLVQEAERRADEREVDLGDFRVLIAEAQAERLEGATVDFVERVNESGFEVRPRPVAADGGGQPSGNGHPAPGSGSGERASGEIADKVRQVLDEQVNPAIAAHGGAISLVDVRDKEVYLEMSGGCQGCAMSRMTLRQGVERMLRQAIPELEAIHDITDHASGANPYFEETV